MRHVAPYIPMIYRNTNKTVYLTVCGLIPLLINISTDSVCSTAKPAENISSYWLLHNTKSLQRTSEETQDESRLVRTERKNVLLHEIQIFMARLFFFPPASLDKQKPLCYCFVICWDISTCSVFWQRFARRFLNPDSCTPKLVGIIKQKDLAWFERRC